MIFSADELADMRSCQDAHMMDTGVVMLRSRQFDKYGTAAPDYTEQPATACGVDMRPGSVRKGPDATLITYDAALRLPIDTDIHPLDHFKVTHRFGEALTVPIEYEVDGPVQRGPSGVRVLLKLVRS